MGYTVVNVSSGDVIAAGLTVDEAAQEILMYDGRDYELRRREDGDGFDLWTRQQVANRGWRMTRFFSLAETEDEAWAEIAAEVVETHDAFSPGSHGPDIMTDEQYAEMLAQSEEDDE